MHYKLRKNLGKDQLLKAYNAYVKPILHYRVLAHTSTDKTKLEAVELKNQTTTEIFLF